MAYVQNVWARASSFDPTVEVSPKHFRRLVSKRLLAEPYSRSVLFDRMTKGEVGLFEHVPIQVERRSGETVEEALTQAMRRSFAGNARARVQLGPKAQRRAVSIPTLLDLWEKRQAIVSTTDLHFRETPLMGQIKADALSDFNILCAEPDVMPLEMMTLVVGSAGNVTDSHSDDADGSNHCFVGTKLWIGWDTHEGHGVGLQDGSHEDIATTAKFNLRAWLGLKSARWWLVGPGQTLFLPGHLTHKVITLESYLGFGSFHVSYPAYWRTISRWILHHTTDVTDYMLREINERAVRQLARLKRATRSRRLNWGVTLLPLAFERWMSQQVPGREKVLENRVLREFMKVAL